MIQVLIDGLAGPYTAKGNYLSEDDRYLCLDDGGIRVNIPVKRILKIEDLRDVMPEPPVEQIVPESPPPPPEPPAAQPPVKLTPESLQKMLRKNVHKVAPDARPLDEGGSKVLNVVMTGDVTKTLTLDVPASAYVPNIYTPAISKAISGDDRIKAVMDNGIIFDGKPTVIGDNVYIKTRKLQDQVGSTMSKLAVASKVANAVSQFQQPDKMFQSDFSMNSDNPQDDFVITQSPFDGPVLLNDPEPAEELRLSEEVVDEGIREEAEFSEAGTDSEVPEVQG